MQCKALLGVRCQAKKSDDDIHVTCQLTDNKQADIQRTEKTKDFLELRRKNSRKQKLEIVLNFKYPEAICVCDLTQDEPQQVEFQELWKKMCPK